VEKRIAALDLIEFGVPILRGTTLDDVSYVHLLPLKLDGLEDLGQELAGPSYKRFSLHVFITSRTFPDDHQSRLFASLSEYKVSPGSVKLASPTVP